MYEKLPSLLGFQPKFSGGGPARFHLPLLYDLVARRNPKSIVVLGFGDGQAFFTFCQASREQRRGIAMHSCSAGSSGENAADDLAWHEGEGLRRKSFMVLAPASSRVRRGGAERVRR